jgi:phosphatidylserine/phosphatidylglycerophosphate/cardiolipin synthase-like enzyme
MPYTDRMEADDGTNTAQFWRREKATRAGLVVDAKAYFEVGRKAMLKARKRIMLIGWDFDARIELSDERLPGEPRTLGEFVLWLVKRNPDLEVFLLRWNMGAVRTLFRGTTIFTLMRWMAHPRIHTRLDSAVTLGASHHHKIVVIDDCLAFCGGIDMTSNRWDTPEHRDDDPRRVGPDGSPYAPWHDATTILEGPVAAALGELSRHRWRKAGGAELAPVEGCGDCWPDGLDAGFQDIAVAICRSRPADKSKGDGEAAVREIEATYLALIARAKRYIYAESQYFASRRIAEAIAHRLEEPDGPEIVLVNPFKSQGWLEPVAMDTARARLYGALHRLDRHGRLRLYHPFTAQGEPIYVHAKMTIVDDEVLHVGSSNMNNRSMRLDTECDVTIDAAHPGNEGAADQIRSLRDSLLAEHLGVPAAEVAVAIDAKGSMIEAIEELRGEGRSLRPYEIPDLEEVEKWLADNQVLDPEGPEDVFEAMSNGGLLRGLRHHLHTHADRLRHRLHYPSRA